MLRENQIKVYEEVAGRDRKGEFPAAQLECVSQIVLIEFTIGLGKKGK
jgi:hypothetical protein